VAKSDHRLKRPSDVTRGIGKQSPSTVVRYVAFPAAGCTEGVSVVWEDACIRFPLVVPMQVRTGETTKLTSGEPPSSSEVPAIASPASGDSDWVQRQAMSTRSLSVALARRSYLSEEPCEPMTSDRSGLPYSFPNAALASCTATMTHLYAERKGNPLTRAQVGASAVAKSLP
jgi:hypothetical protein